MRIAEFMIVWVGTLGWTQQGSSSGLGSAHLCIYDQLLVSHAALFLGGRVCWLPAKVTCVTGPFVSHALAAEPRTVPMELIVFQERAELQGLLRSRLALCHVAKGCG